MLKKVDDRFGIVFSKDCDHQLGFFLCRYRGVVKAGDGYSCEIR